MSVLEVKNIKKNFGKTEVLKGISFSLEKGEVDVDGRIDSFAYSDVEEAGKKAASFLGRLFQ